jgi:MFS family permease
MTTGLVAQAVALGWMSLVLGPTTPYAQLVPAFALAGLGMGLTFAPSATAVLADLSEADHAVATSANATLREVGVALGIAVLVAVFQARGGALDPARFAQGVPAAVAVGAGVVALGAVAALALPGRRRSAPAPAPLPALAEVS